MGPARWRARGTRRAPSADGLVEMAAPRTEARPVVAEPVVASMEGPQGVARGPDPDARADDVVGLDVEPRSPRRRAGAPPAVAADEGVVDGDARLEAHVQARVPPEVVDGVLPSHGEDGGRRLGPETSTPPTVLPTQTSLSFFPDQYPRIPSACSLSSIPLK